MSTKDIKESLKDQGFTNIKRVKKFKYQGLIFRTFSSNQGYFAVVCDEQEKMLSIWEVEDPEDTQSIKELACVRLSLNKPLMEYVFCVVDYDWDEWGGPEDSKLRVDVTSAELWKGGETSESVSGFNDLIHKLNLPLIEECECEFSVTDPKMTKEQVVELLCRYGAVKDKEFEELVEEFLD